MHSEADVTFIHIRRLAAVIVVGLGVLLLARAGQLHGRPAMVAGHLLLQGTVLPYALRYFVAPPAANVQKAAVAALILVLVAGSHLTHPAPDTVDVSPETATLADPGVPSV